MKVIFCTLIIIFSGLSGPAIAASGGGDKPAPPDPVTKPDKACVTELKQPGEKCQADN